MSGQKIIDGLNEALEHAKNRTAAARAAADAELVLAIAELRAKLPGWWFTVGECSVSCDASVGPDQAYVPEPALSRFDAGFDVDLRQPSTMAQALRAATEAAMEAVDGAV